jgi:signal transduction histidine kinase
MSIKVNKRTDSFDLVKVFRRIHEKKDDYLRYRFSRAQDDIFKTFFDLAQEYDSIENFYRISVAVIKCFMMIDVRLHLWNQSKDELIMVCDSVNGISYEEIKASSPVKLSKESYFVDVSFFVPIYSKRNNREKATQVHSTVLGMLEVLAHRELSEQEQLFLKKYANRVGFNLHNRNITRQNITHLQFIKNLVQDIEHNVIIPNMYFTHLFNRLLKKIKEVKELEKNIGQLHLWGKSDEEICDQIHQKMSLAFEDLLDIHKDLQKHHVHTSMFLESLFRRDHFEKGHLVLHSKKCFVDKEIIAPQLDHYKNRLKHRGISIERPLNMIEEEIPLRVDIGLLSQVYANLFSNAVKYTMEIIDYDGRPVKSLAYGREVFMNYFGSGKDGIKFNVFTTGSHLAHDDAASIFDEGHRGRNTENESGTGHGLKFIKQVIEIHNGIVGYEPTAGGNNFYFILPLPQF